MTKMTVAELTKRVLPEASEDELAAAQRQLRYWTLDRIFPTLDYVNIKTGSGRHREYEGDTLPLAAIAVEIGCRWRLSADLLRRVMFGVHVLVGTHVLDGIPTPIFDKRLKARWDAAIAGQPGVFMVLQLPRTSIATQVVLDLVGIGEVTRYLASPACASTIVVNLSSVLARLRG
jgi:hypothetical protein